MVSTQSPPNSLHYSAIAKQAENTFVPAALFIRFTEFSGNAEIETETDTGHTGTKSLKLGEDRTQASAAPEINDRLRPKQGMEDFFYHILGGLTITVAKEGATKAKKWTIIPTDGDLPVVSITHGFNYSAIAARGFPNAIANELELSMSSTESPTIRIGYLSDFPTYGVVEPLLSFVSDAPQSFKPGHLSVYMAGTDVGNLNDTHKIGCMTEASLTISNNIETSICAGNELGTVDKDIGELTIEGSMTLKYRDEVELEREWATGTKVGTKVTYASLMKQLKFLYKSDKIETVTGTPNEDFFYQLGIHLKKVDIKSAKESEGGDGSKTIEIEFSAVAPDTGNIIDVEIITEATAAS